MTIRSLLLYVASETCDPDRGAAAYSLGLARSFDAQLEAIVLELDDVTSSSAHSQLTAPEARTRMHERNGQVAVAGEALRAAARDRGVEALVITDRWHISDTPEIAAVHARLVDLVIAGVGDKGLPSEQLVAETLIFQSGRPVIIVPDDNRGYRAERVVVAWDFSRVAARALSDALPFLRRAEEVMLVTFSDDKEFPSSLIQDEVLEALGRRGVAAGFLQMERGSRNIGEAINVAAADRRADLLVMGGYGHSRFREFVLGGATRTILLKPALPTLMSH